MKKTKKAAPKSKWAAFAASDGTFDFEALSDAEKEDLYRKCESIGGDEIGSPLTPAQRRLHERVLRGRPRKGNGAQIVSLSIERDCFGGPSGLRRRRVFPALNCSAEASVRYWRSRERC